MIEIQDTARHRGLRKELVSQLREKGIASEEVLAAINKVPRHLFFGKDTIFDVRAYENTAHPIGEDQTISHPYTVAFQSQLLDLKPGEKVLEIGTGSGYQASVLAVLGVKVFSIERQKKLFEKTKPLLAQLGYSSIKCFFGDGFEGLPSYAPFHKIIVTAAAPSLPNKLLDQLAIGGCLVIPQDHADGSTQMKRYTKHSARELEEETFETFRFVPMLKGKVF